MRFLLYICLSLFFVSCTESNIRGTIETSKDGKTYLKIVEKNGNACKDILVDGNVWGYKIGEVGIIESGKHVIECGGEIHFEIPKGVIFTFNYWGP